MPSRLPLWFQGLPSGLRRRLELAEATAWEDRSATHAAEALELVEILAPRMPFDEALDRYIDIMSLGGDEAEVIRTRALAALSESDLAADASQDRDRPGLGLDWRYATPLGAVRFVRRQIRRNAEEDLWTELVAASAEEALILTHIRHAVIFSELLRKHAAPPRSVSFYLDRLEVPAARARSVYQRALAQLAETHLPRIFGQSEKREEEVAEPALKGS